MTLETQSPTGGNLEKAKSELQALARIADSEIGSVSRVFTGLAANTDTILSLAAAIVACAEHENVTSVLPKVQSLGDSAKVFIADRLQATTGILETVTREAKLLGDLLLITRGQASVARETKVLSVLTNIEVARLGAVGAGFQYLAQELSDFSKSVAEDTQALLTHTDGRRAATEETRRVLSDELPRLRVELGRMETDLGDALAGVDSSLRQLSRTPAQFKICVQDIARQIAGVVAAIQAHDITRQQIDHVQRGLALVSDTMRATGATSDNAPEDLSGAYAGLAIQIYQLRSIKQTVANWASQIRTCITDILRISASDVAGIGPAVLKQEQEVSSQLAQIEQLERRSQAYSERIRNTLGGLSSLMQLVGDHLKRSNSVHERLQLLTFNSIIEANRLGKQASAIMAIARSIEGISVKWGLITAQARQAMQEIASLVKQTTEVMQIFSESGNQNLREAQSETRAGLDHLQTAGAFVARKAGEMTLAMERMQARVAKIGNSSDVLDACISRFDAVLCEVEGVRQQLKSEHPEASAGFNAEDVERTFSVFYTTEMEREVLRAALAGSSLPIAQTVFSGNSVELF